jgi:ribosomal protein L31
MAASVRVWGSAASGSPARRKTRARRSVAWSFRASSRSASHPFYTGKQRFVDAAGRIDKFRSKYGTSYVKKKGAAATSDAPPATK